MICHQERQLIDRPDILDFCVANGIDSKQCKTISCFILQDY